MMSHETLAMEANGKFFLNFDDINVNGNVDVASTNVVIQTNTEVVLVKAKNELSFYSSKDERLMSTRYAC